MNERMMGLSGLVGDPFYPEIGEALPPVPLGRAGERLAKGFNAKGWHWWPSFSAIATRAQSERGACLNLGPCNTGCPQGAKASADNTYLKEAGRLGLTLVPEFAVSRVLVRDGKACGVEGFDDAGERRTFEADRVVLASSAIGTPRILFASRTNERPHGLGNTTGNVGRHLMMHPLGHVEGTFNRASRQRCRTAGLTCSTACCFTVRRGPSTSVSRPNGSGPIPRLHGRHPRCWACSRSSRCGRTNCVPAKHRRLEGQPVSKQLPTFSDALALVRRELWTRPGFDISLNGPRLIEMPRSAINALIGAACYAA